jgi:RNA polymerase sigma factor (sigma-70 family)
VTEYHYETPLEQALDVANALLVKRVLHPWGHVDSVADEDELRASLALKIVEGMQTYDPSKGAVTTFTYSLFANWNYDRVQEEKARAHHLVLLSPVADDDELTLADVAEHVEVEPVGGEELSDLALGIIDQLPDHTRPTLELHWGYGASTSATAEQLGISSRTVTRHAAAARAHLAGVGMDELLARAA